MAVNNREGNERGDRRERRVPCLGHDGPRSGQHLIPCGALGARARRREQQREEQRGRSARHPRLR